MKPFSGPCERNQQPILDVLREAFNSVRSVLEIGSGTGQHAVYMGRHLPHLIWHTADLAENHAGIRMWLEEAGLANVNLPLVLDLRQPDWPETGADAFFTANTLHIVSWELVRAMFFGAARTLPPGGLFAIYGPFHYHGEPTSPGNAQFDVSLRTGDPSRGIRDMDDVQALADEAGLHLVHDYAMPANNRIHLWRVDHG